VYNPNQLTKKERGRSHKIVEECMLIANKVAARKIINMNSDTHDLGLYRNHDLPSLKNENYIKDIMANFSKQKIVSKKLNASSINEFLKKINDKSTRGIISFLLIRKMKKAFYSSKNIGHYGLGFDEYTHFTSPIRRYSDLLVHRLLKKQMKKKANIMESIDFCNSGEEKAKLASRDYLRLKGLRWLESRIDKSLQGVIIDIKSKYLVVNETSTEITGKIDIKNLPKDVYVLASNKLTLLGKYSKSKFGVGEKINIKVSQIDMINQDISFELKQG